MSIWFNRFTCPGWTFVPRKPHPFGNEYHSICCGKSGIMYAVEIVEGKDYPKKRTDETNINGKTVGLSLRLTRRLHGTGRLVILDSGFCVLKGLVEFKKIGVFASAVIKKRRYWPKFIKGEEINDYMKDKKNGYSDVATGILEGVKYNVFVMKDVGFCMKLMATYGDLTPTESDNNSASRSVEKPNGMREKIEFKYSPPFENHYLYRHAVDDHNNLRHSTPSLEGTWITQRWVNRVFAFFLAITEVNTYLYFRYFFFENQPKIPHSTPISKATGGGYDK